MSSVINSADSNSNKLFGAFHDKKLLYILEKTASMYQMGTKRPIMDTNGLTITFHTLTAIEDGDKLTENTDPTASDVTASTKTATVLELGGKKIISNRFSKAAVVNMVDEITTRFGYSANRTIDKYLQNTCFSAVSYTKLSAAPLNTSKISALLSGGASTYFPLKVLKEDASANITECTGITGQRALTSVSATLSKMTLAKVRYVINKFESNDVPKFDNNSYVCVAQPSVVNYLRQDPKFIEWARYANADLMFKGEVGMIEGCRFIKATNMYTFDSTKGSHSSGQIANLSVFLGYEAFAITEFSSEQGIQTYVVPFEKIDHDHAMATRATLSWRWMGAAVVLQPKAGFGTVTLNG